MAQDIVEKTNIVEIERFQAVPMEQEKNELDKLPDVRVRQPMSKEERRLVLKQDLLILPLLLGSIFFAYLVSRDVQELGAAAKLSIGSEPDWECSGDGHAERLGSDRPSVLQLSDDVL